MRQMDDGELDKFLDGASSKSSFAQSSSLRSNDEEIPKQIKEDLKPLQRKHPVPPLPQAQDMDEHSPGPSSHTMSKNDQVSSAFDTYS